METFRLVCNNFMSGTEVSYNLRVLEENSASIENMETVENTPNMSEGEKEPEPDNSNMDDAMQNSATNDSTRNINEVELVYNTPNNFGNPENINAEEALPIGNTAQNNDIQDILEILENPTAEVQVLQRMEPTKNGLQSLQDMRDSDEYSIHDMDEVSSRNEILLLNYARNLHQNNQASLNPSTFDPKEEADKIVSGYYLDINESLMLFRGNYHRQSNPFLHQHILAMEYLKFMQEEHNNCPLPFQNFNFSAFPPRRNIQRVPPLQFQRKQEETRSNGSISTEDQSIATTDQSKSEEMIVDPEPENQGPGKMTRRLRRKKMIKKKRPSAHTGKRNLFERKPRQKIGDGGRNMERIMSLRSYTSNADKTTETINDELDNLTLTDTAVTHTT